jgi:hypothetical protein
MNRSADEILEEIKALPPSDRRRIVATIAREAAHDAEAPTMPALPVPGLWNDVDDAEYARFQEALAELRTRPARA